MNDKRFLVSIPEEKYNEAMRLAKANGTNVSALVRSLLFRAIMMPEEFGFVQEPAEVEGVAEPLNLT
jgi:hypothetical protein